MDLKKLFYPLIIVVLVAVIFFQTCESPDPGSNPPKIDTLVRVDTIYKIDSFYSKPTVIRSNPDTKWINKPEYLPDTNYTGLLDKYIKLGDKYFARNIYQDSLKLDSFGYVAVNDSVVQNEIIGRSYKYTLKIPEKTTTITIKEPYKPVGQLYFGGGINGNQTDFVKSAEVGFLYKTKKDQIYGVKAGLDNTGQTVYGIQSYWKISFRKK